MRTLVAGVGNIFLGDDAFGVEVVQRMIGTPMPEGVELIDFGIRGVHLAYQLLDGYDLLVLVDAAPRGEWPGTVSLLEVDQSQIPAHDASVSPLVDGHGMEPVAILRILGSLGGSVAKVLVVACEPASVEEGLGLSDVVSAAIPDAIATVDRIVRAEHEAHQSSQQEVSG